MRGSSSSLVEGTRPSRRRPARVLVSTMGAGLDSRLPKNPNPGQWARRAHSAVSLPLLEQQHWAPLSLKTAWADIDRMQLELLKLRAAAQ